MYLYAVQAQVIDAAIQTQAGLDKAATEFRRAGQEVAVNVTLAAERIAAAAEQAALPTATHTVLSGEHALGGRALPPPPGNGDGKAG
jgi:hypothetical protein